MSRSMPRKSQRRNYRSYIRKAHLFLGFTTGLIVFIVAITGCGWVFQQEIRALTSDKLTVHPQERSMISPTRVKRIGLTVFPGRRTLGAVYGKSDEPIELIFYEEDPEFYRSVFINPYNGTIMKTENNLSGFFPFLLDGHLHLWLPHEVGKQVVSWGVLIFVFNLITGFLLWWPRNKNNRKQRMWFRWRSTTKWKRKNFDLHAILGFYVLVFALLFILTGLTMSFQWFKQGVYTGLGGDKTAQFQVPDNISSGSDTLRRDRPPIDRLPAQIYKEYPGARSFEVHYPHSDTSSIYVEISYEEGIFYNNDYLFYDQRTLEKVAAPSLYGAYQKANLPDKLIRMNYDIHVGSILGLPGKILAFLASLTIASLPVTGFMLWWGRHQKRKWPLQRKNDKLNGKRKRKKPSQREKLVAE